MNHNEDNDDDNDGRKMKPEEKPADATAMGSTSDDISSQARKDIAIMQPGLSSDPALNEAASPGGTNLPARRHPAVPTHNRQVSWDQKLVVEGEPTTTYSPNTGSYSPVPEGILQPIPEGNPPPPIHENLLQPTLTGASSSTTFKALHLEDVVQQTPYEAEAETYILKVLEQRDPTYSPHLNQYSRFGNNETISSATSILSNVPEVSHNFSMTEDYNDYDDDGINIEQTSVGSNNQSEISATTSHSRRKQQQQQQPSTGRTSHIWDNSHNQNRTVEQTLFGLTSALQAMNTLADTPPNPVAAWDAAGKEYNNITNMNTHHRRTGSSAEQLAVNASLLFQRKKNDAPTPDDNISVVSGGGGGGGSDIDGSVENRSSLGSVPASPNPSGRWTALRTAVGGGRKRSDSNAHDSVSIHTPAAQEEIPEGDEEEGGLSDVEPDGDPLQGDDSATKKLPEPTKKKRISFAAHIKEEWDYVNRFQHLRNATRNPLASAIYVYCKVVLLYLILPSTGISAILFHLADNPPTGYNVPASTSGADVHSSTASASWWLLFLGVRQVITFSLAMGTELIVIDWLSIRVRGTLKVFGPWITLMIVQSKGWPFVIFAWGMYDFCLLYGNHRFYEHWLFWQDTLDMFTDKNPAGQVISSDTYRRILTVAVSVGIVVAIKRFWLALFLGKQTFGKWHLWVVRPLLWWLATLNSRAFPVSLYFLVAQYAEKLAGVMRKILLVTQVASTSRDFERYARSRLHSEMKSPPPMSYYGADVLANFVREAEGDEDSQYTPSIQGPQSSASQAPLEDYLINPDDRDPLTGSLSSLQRSKIIQILGRWEEPEIAESRQQPISVSALLQFRRALASINTPFPFSGAFGIGKQPNHLAFLFCLKG
jgi:hypothetical protein